MTFLQGDEVAPLFLHSFMALPTRGTTQLTADLGFCRGTAVITSTHHHHSTRCCCCAVVTDIDSDDRLL